MRTKKDLVRISWENFKLPRRFEKRISSVSCICRKERIVARAKSLLSGFSISFFDSNIKDWRRDLNLQELEFANELRDIWRKKYKETLKQHEEKQKQLKEQKIAEAFKSSKSKQYIKKKEKKKKSFFFVSTPPINKSYLETAYLDLLNSSKICALCSGTKVLRASGKNYPCPACNNVELVTQKSSEKQINSSKCLGKTPKLGKRKIKFK